MCVRRAKQDADTKIDDNTLIKRRLLEGGWIPRPPVVCALRTPVGIASSERKAKSGQEEKKTKCS